MPVFVLYSATDYELGEGYASLMEAATEQQQVTTFHLSLCLKCSTIFLLLLFSVALAACDAGSTTTMTNLGEPQVTVTIHFHNNASLVPTVAPYLCGAWITNTTPAFKPGDKIPVYAHFIHLVNGNPVGVSGASAQANVEWADGDNNRESTMTTADGLAVFYFTIPNRPNMVNRNNLVTVSFTGPNGETCNVDNQSQPAAFFTLIQGSATTSNAPPTASQPKKHRRGRLLLN
jgi:hypothetical protein